VARADTMKRNLARHCVPLCIVALTALAMPVWLPGPFVPAEEILSGETAKQYALMLCDGFDKNREAFQQFTCRFTVVCGRTQCPGQWWRGDSWGAEMETVRQTAEGLLARDGNVFRYKLMPGKVKVEFERAPVQDMVGHTGEKNSVAFFSSGLGYGTEDMLFDDEFVINDPEMGPQAIISPINEWPEFRGLMITPWQPRFLNPNAFLEDVRICITQYNTSCKVTRDMPFGSGRVTLVEFGTVYYVDEERGYIPRKALYVHHKERVKALFTEAGYVEGKGWFPMKWTLVDSPYAEDKVVSCFVTELRVTELTMERPGRELLTMKVSKGRHFIDQTNLGKLKQLVIEEDTDVGIKDVPKLVDRYRNPTYSEVPRKPVGKRVVVVACGMLVVAGVGYAYYLYRRRLGR
jgi:hypothetical protein